MPTITVGDKSHEVPDGTRLVLAIEELGVEIGHRCGGKARCTTCRVEFIEGEPDTMTEAEHAKLREKGLLGELRLSCQILCEHDMTVEPKQTKQTEGWPDTGPRPADRIEPPPVWRSREELEARA